MGSMGKVATWLELAAAPHSRDKTVILRVHPLVYAAEGKLKKPGGNCCYAVSVDGRWVCFNDGRLTVLKGQKAVDRFMHLINMPHYESGDPAQIEIECGKTAYCIAAGSNQALRGCA